MAAQQQPPTVYKGVTYVGKGSGTLKLHDELLTFQMYDATAANNVKIFTLPWSKVKRRQVNSSEPRPTSTSSTSKGTTKPKIKLILHSGTEAIFQMEDRITLEVLRDDVAERLQRYKIQHPDSDDEQAVNQTRGATQSDRRMSTPYRMSKPAAAPAAKVTQPRAPQPYRMAVPATTNKARAMSPPLSSKSSSTATKPMMRRHSQPATTPPYNSNVGGTRQPQPYRMKQKEPTPEPRSSQPYRFVQKK